MFLRLMFVLLVALNIAVGAWLLLGQPYARGGMPADVGVPELRLLSEVPEPAVASANLPAAAKSVSTSVVVAPPAATTAPRGPTCRSFGPFGTPQDLRHARDALSGPLIRTRTRQEQVTQPQGWWVYLPALPTRAKALARARDLADHHIGDYFVVSSGDQPNTISLGLFKDEANAHKRRAEVIAAGFPAQLAERSETVPEYWLDIAVAGEAGAGWRARVPAGLKSHSSGCF